MAKRQLRQASTSEKDESLIRIFFKGFFLPVKLIGRGLAWLSHRPPLRQIGHGLRWVGKLRIIRFIAKLLGIRYLWRSSRELRSVTWPSFRESVRLTTAVIIFSIVFGVFVALVDYGLDKLFKPILLK